MKLNQVEFKKLIVKEFNNNYNECARALNVDTSTVWRAANGKSKGGIKLIGSLINYCSKKELDYNKYIFLS